MERRFGQEGGRDRGATLLEFAIILPVFVLLVFASIDFVVVLTNYSGLRNGTREGARAAIVGEWGTDVSCPVTGAAPNASTHALICRTKERVGLDDADVRVMIDWTTTYAPGRPLLVCAQYPMKSLSGVAAPFVNNRTMKTKVEMRIETITPGLTELSETAHSGSDWSFCT